MGKNYVRFCHVTHTAWIRLTQGQETQINSSDLPRVTARKWYAVRQRGQFRAVTKEGQKMIYLHRIITDCPDGFEVDHINGNPLDNRRCNLRVCSQYQNSCNRKPDKRNRSGYKGVRRRGLKWVAEITVKGETRFLGSFGKIQAAASAYNRGARKFFKSFANLNPITA